MTTVDTKKILIIDDEEHILEMLRINMRTHGYSCKTATSGEEGLALLSGYQPDLILLDVMLPGIDGVEVCKQLKDNDEYKRIPVLMLSAKSEGNDRIAGLEGGADDYITKPFSIKELFLRINAALRQVELLTSVKQSIYTAGSLTLDVDKYMITSCGERIDLTLTEFRILHLLLSKKGTAVPRELLLTEIFGKSEDVFGRSLDVHIRNIRKKLDNSMTEGVSLQTVRGTGYMLCEEC